MRRLSLCFAAILFFSSSALAQRTVVSGTVTDLNGIPYSGGTLEATLTLPLGAGGATLNGVQISGATQRVTLDSAGSFLMQLPDNNVVLPGGTQWTFAVNISPGVAPPLGTGPQSCTATLTITGASQSISSNLSVCPALTRSIISSATTTQVPGIIASASPYNAKFDGRTTTDGVINNGSPTATSAITSCVPLPVPFGDLGKQIFTVNPGSFTSAFKTTVASCIGAGFVGAANATASETGDNFVVCSDDTTALTNAWNAAIVANLPLLLPTGLGCVASRPFFVPNLSLLQQPQQTVSLSGAGMNASVIGMMPTFSFTGVLGGAIFDDVIGQSCTWQSTAQRVFTVSTVQDFSVTGFGFNFPTWPANIAVFGSKACQVHRTGIFSINTSSTMVGISAPSESFIDNNNIQGLSFGATGILLTGAGTTASGNIIAFGTAGGTGYSVLNCTSECAIIGGFTTSLTTGIKVVNSILSVVDGQLSTGSSTTGITVDATSIVNVARMVLVQSGVASSVGINVAAGGKLRLTQMDLVTSGTPTEIINAGSVFDACGNNLTGTITNTGSWFGSCSITGTAQTGGNIAISACGTSTAGTVSGAGGRGQFTITFAGAPGTSCTATVTFPTVFPVAPSCSFLDVGGTNAFPTSIVNGTINTTSAAMTETAGAFTNGNTEIMQYNCAIP